jgi:hypothetical protein
VSSQGVVTGVHVLGDLGTSASGVVGGAVVGAAVGLAGAGARVGGVAGAFIAELSHHRHWARDVSMVPV